MMLLLALLPALGAAPPAGGAAALVQGVRLLEVGRTRGALRNFERVLATATIGDEVNSAEVWDASVNSALCLVLLSEAEAKRDEQSDRWSSQLPEARLRLWRALNCSPSDTRLIDLLRRTEAVRQSQPEEVHEVRRVLWETTRARRALNGVAVKRSWEDDCSDYEGRHHAGAGTLLICFAGADSNLGGGADGGVQRHSFMAACSRAGVRHALFVRDASRGWYERGIDGEGRDFASVVSLLREEVWRMRPSRLVTLGSSMGGYAAVRAGLALDADLAIAFSPQAVLHVSTREALGVPPAPFDMFLLGLEAFAAVEGFEPQPLSAVIAETAWSTTCAIEVHVGGADEGDLIDAELLRRAVEERRTRGALGISCEIVVHPGEDHNLVCSMRDSGELHAMLQRAASLSAGDA